MPPPPRSLRLEAQTGSGAVHVQRYWVDLPGIIERGEFDFTFVVIHRLPLERAGEAYELFDNKEDNALKVALTLDHACAGMNR